MRYVRGNSYDVASIAEWHKKASSILFLACVHRVLRGTYIGASGSVRLLTVDSWIFRLVASWQHKEHDILDCTDPRESQALLVSDGECIKAHNRARKARSEYSNA